MLFESTAIIKAYPHGDYVLAEVNCEGETLLLGALLRVIADHEQAIFDAWRNVMIASAKVALRAKGYDVGKLVYDSTAARTGESGH